MKTEIPLLPIIAAAAIYVFGLLMLSLHLVRSFAILTAQNNWMDGALERLLEF